MTEIQICLLPGMLTDRRVWEPVWAKASDQLSFATPQWFDFSGDERQSITAMAAFVLAQATAPRLILAGFSMGAHVAYEVFRQAPNRVAGLLVCNSSAGLDPDERRQEREHFLSLPDDFGRFDGITGANWPKFVARANLENKAMLALVQDMARVHGMTGAKAQTKALLERQESFEQLAQMADLQVPMRFVAGQEDVVTRPAQALEMALAARQLPDDIIEIAAGHLGPLEAPGAVADVLMDLSRAVVAQGPQ